MDPSSVMDSRFIIFLFELWNGTTFVLVFSNLRDVFLVNFFPNFLNLFGELYADEDFLFRLIVNYGTTSDIPFGRDNT